MRQKNILFLIIVLLVTNSLSGQIATFEKTYSHADSADLDGVLDAIQTNDGQYVLVGITRSYIKNTDDIYLLKIDSLGDTVWTKTYYSIKDEWAGSVAQTFDGGYILAGRSSNKGPGVSSVYIIKTDAFGDILWTRNYGGPNFDAAQDVLQTLDGGYAIVGYTYSFGSGSSDFYLIRTDDKGDTLWTKTFGGNSDDFAIRLRKKEEKKRKRYYMK